MSIWQLAFPSILGNLSYTLVGMVQVKFVGELGTEALAAMGAGSRVFFALQAIMMAISAGTTALVARAWGAGDYEEASRVTMASMVLAGLLSLLIAVLALSWHLTWQEFLAWTRLLLIWRLGLSSGYRF